MAIPGKLWTFVSHFMSCEGQDMGFVLIVDPGPSWRTFFRTYPLSWEESATHWCPNDF